MGKKAAMYGLSTIISEAIELMASVDLSDFVFEWLLYRPCGLRI